MNKENAKTRLCVFFPALVHVAEVDDAATELSAIAPPSGEPATGDDSEVTVKIIF